MARSRGLIHAIGPSVHHSFCCCALLLYYAINRRSTPERTPRQPATKTLGVERKRNGRLRRAHRVSLSLSLSPPLSPFLYPFSSPSLTPLNSHRTLCFLPYFFDFCAQLLPATSPVQQGACVYDRIGWAYTIYPVIQKTLQYYLTEGSFTQKNQCTSPFEKII